VLAKKIWHGGVFGPQENTNTNKHMQKNLAIGIWPLNSDAMASKMQPFKLFVNSEPKTQLVDLQVEEVLNENLNLPKGNIHQYYMDINKQCEDDDFQLNNMR
jgi:hypothetical protein